MTTKTIELTTTHWNDLTERYDSVMSSDPAYRRLLSAIMRLLPPGCRSILDLGCGSGAVTYLCHRLLPDAEIVGLDPAPKMIEQARSRLGRAPNVSFVEGTASDLSDFATGRFDAYVEAGLRLWDIAAGGLIIECAGGEFWHRRQSGSDSYDVLASNGKLRRPLRGVMDSGQR